MVTWRTTRQDPVSLRSHSQERGRDLPSCAITSHGSNVTKATDHCQKTLTRDIYVPQTSSTSLPLLGTRGCMHWRQMAEFRAGQIDLLELWQADTSSWGLCSVFLSVWEQGCPTPHHWQLFWDNGMVCSHVLLAPDHSEEGSGAKLCMEMSWVLEYEYCHWHWKQRMKTFLM